jgi:uncharacterized repeat protein (TIGR03803 family)
MAQAFNLRCSLFGSAIVLAAVGMVTSASASAMDKENILHRFVGGSDGSIPMAGLTMDSAGNLYGTTHVGGGGAGCFEGNKFGCGSVFEIEAGESETVLHAFAGGCDGALPEGGVIVDSQNNQYGTTSGGGTCGSDGGFGTVFKLAPGGSETILYAFQGGSDGGNPLGNIVSDADGNLFGATSAGGYMAGCGGNGCGVVFEVSSAGNETVLHTFQGTSDGLQPDSGLMIDGSGNLIGTTSHGGGSANCSGGCGALFKVTPDGTETILYAFQGGTDGCFPMAGLISDSAGNFYGTTEACGAVGYGTVFKVTPTGSETILHSFQAGSDGELPLAALVMDKSGNLFGTTPAGGATGCRQRGSCGTVFEVTAKGREKVLYAFHKVRGSYPAAGLLLGAHGDLYGATAMGGTGNNGVVFELKK